jgi:ketosteroid isomerase-like protein
MRAMRIRIAGALAALALAAACAKPRPKYVPPPPPAAGDLTPALAKLKWWLGSWAAASKASGDDGSETWVAADGALYGVALHTNGSFEAMVVDDAEGPGPADGKLRFFAMPEGRVAVEFDVKAATESSVVFANGAQDWPQTIAYARTGEGLTATLGGDPEKSFQYASVDPKPEPEVEAADRAFAKATAERGADGWTEAFAPDGAMGRAGKRIEHDGVKAAIAPLLASGKLDWAPTASGRLGDLAFTIGKAKFEPKSGKPADAWRSTYVTIWHREGDAWKVRFDTGRVVNE